MSTNAPATATSASVAPTPRPSLLARWRANPNPIWIRELTQNSRLVRTPFILMSLSVLITLALTALAASMDERSRDRVGLAIFQAFFSLAYFVVAIAGPAVAANSIASEREGRTWEALMLTGLSPEVVARGKFLSALTSIATYLVMIAPIGALSFLFGGVSALEVVIAYVLLMGMAAMFVLLGLAISSQTQSARAALVATILFIVPVSGFVYLSFGFVGSGFAHAFWPKVSVGLPVWMPAAYVRGDFDLAYVVLLLIGPIIGFLVPAWFLYRTVVANLRDASDDQSTGHKKWFALSVPLVAAYAALFLTIVEKRSAAPCGVAGVVLLMTLLLFSTLVFAAEPSGPSRRVRAQWERIKSGPMTRFFGPSLGHATTLQLVVGALSFGIVVGSTSLASITNPYDKLTPFLVFAAHLLAFYVFVVGATAFVRSRASSPLVARILVVVIIGALTVAPWVVAIVAGALVTHSDDALFLAAPSPLYALYAANRMYADQFGLNLFASVGMWFIYVLAGLVAAAAGASHLAQKSRLIEERLALTDAQLAEEDRNAMSYSRDEDDDAGSHDAATEEASDGAEAGDATDSAATDSAATDSAATDSAATDSASTSTDDGDASADEPPREPSE